MQCCSNSSSKIKLVNRNVDLLKTIGEPNRLKILCILKNGRLCECEIIRFLKLKQNLMAHHLRMLEKANLLKSKKEGRKVFYSLNKKEVRKLNSFLNKVLGGTK